MTNKNKINELTSIALWAAQRLSHDSRKKYVLEEVLKTIGEEHEYAESIKKDLNELATKKSYKAPF